MTCKSGNGPCWTKRWTLCWTFSCPPYRSGLDGEIHGRGIGCSGSTCGLRQRPRAVYPFARRDVSSTATSRHSRGRAGLPSRVILRPNRTLIVSHLFGLILLQELTFWRPRQGSAGGSRHLFDAAPAVALVACSDAEAMNCTQGIGHRAPDDTSSTPMGDGAPSASSGQHGMLASSQSHLGVLHDGRKSKQ